MGGQNLVLHKPWRGAQCLVGTGQVTGRAWRKAVGIGRSEGRLRIKSLQGVGSSPQGVTPNKFRGIPAEGSRRDKSCPMASREGQTGAESANGGFGPGAEGGPGGPAGP